jgi:hypothetical protein
MVVPYHIWAFVGCRPIQKSLCNFTTSSETICEIGKEPQQLAEEFGAVSVARPRRVTETGVLSRIVSGILWKIRAQSPMARRQPGCTREIGKLRDKLKISPHRSIHDRKPL